jgi:hypothetical protein
LRTFGKAKRFETDISNGRSIKGGRSGKEGRGLRHGGKDDYCWGGFFDGIVFFGGVDLGSKLVE